MNEKTEYHIPVLIAEVLEYMAPKENEVYVDVTFGGGGHTEAILKANPLCKVIGVDWHQEALTINGEALKEKYGDRLELIKGSFGHLTKLLKKLNISKIDGILADFGTSQYQIFNVPGLSFHSKEVLDMRMSPQHQKIKAYDIVNYAQDRELLKIFREYGQEAHAHKVVQEIVRYRKEEGKIKTGEQLAKIIASVIRAKSRHIHPATKIFQALRIVVNDELNNIKSLLAQSSKLLNDCGRLVCISFHSLEDFLVKDFLREYQLEFEPLTDKVVTASESELMRNPSSRSAKLRAAKKLPC